MQLCGERILEIRDKPRPGILGGSFVEARAGIIEEGVIHSGDFVDGESTLAELPDLLKSMAGGNRAVKTFIRTT